LKFIRQAFGPALTLIRQHRTAYMVLNLACYGLIAGMMLLATAFPELRVAAQAATDTSNDPLNGLFAATYGVGNVFGAAAATLFVNLIFGTVLTLTLPSLVIPFFAIVFGLLRISSWGLIFAPTGVEDLSWFIPHMITAVIEAQGYILAALAAWIHERMFLLPPRFDLPGRRAGYGAGLRATLRLYPLVIAVLTVAAVWEAVELIHIVPAQFLSWWMGETPVIP
jgi:hypothetical protein